MDQHLKQPPKERLLDQFYTDSNVAGVLYDFLRSKFDLNEFQFIEPSAGTGSFSRLLPPGSLAYDLDPKAPGIIEADFLKAELPETGKLGVVGNPPFGKNSSLAIRFFNHAALKAELIAFIVPATFQKMSVQRRLDPHLHLVAEAPVPHNAFWFCGKRKHVPTVFQIWARRDVKRNTQRPPTRHPDFDFVKNPSDADFVIQRVGGDAGKIHRDFGMSSQSHLFIRPKVSGVEVTMHSLDLASTAKMTAGNPSIAKSEIVRLYTAALASGMQW
ncbi:putative RNA methylase [Porphyrobacter sp. MBR-155]|jgi:predicted RNA methylase|uniref:SAM-dependent methyltransferase n=1 Tax=Porphyrobacter sp. MBR-155 TaxID=3156464 RepID=UPI00339A5356